MSSTESGVQNFQACHTGYILSYDLHVRCEVCLGPEQTGLALTPQALTSLIACPPSGGRETVENRCFCCCGQGCLAGMGLILDPLNIQDLLLKVSESNDSAPSIYGWLGSFLASLSPTGELEFYGSSLCAHPRDLGVPFSTSTALLEVSFMSSRRLLRRQLPMGISWKYQEGAVAEEPESTCFHLHPHQQGGGIYGARLSSHSSSGAQPDDFLWGGMGQHGVWTVPGPAIFQGLTARLSDRAYQCAFQALVAANNISVLAFSLTKLAARSSTMSPEGALEAKGRTAMTDAISTNSKDVLPWQPGLRLAPCNCSASTVTSAGFSHFTEGTSAELQDQLHCLFLVLPRASKEAEQETMMGVGGGWSFNLMIGTQDQHAVNKTNFAAIRDVWDKKVCHLPLLYNPGIDVTVDERLVPLRGHCAFKQYMPSKTGKYGIKIWE
eukprot:superscaffoldBa00000354_g4056